MKAPLIYVVDDEEAMLTMIVLTLKSAGLRVEPFSDPVMALAAFSTADPKPTLLITDYCMPAMGGAELISRCKAMMPTLKTICCSGSATEEDVQSSHLCADLLLRKPFAPDEFRRIVAQMLVEGNPIPEPARWPESKQAGHRA